MNLTARLAALIVCICMSISGYPAERSGADKAYPAVRGYLSQLPFQADILRQLSASEAERLIALSAEQGINVFELIDCAVRYAKEAGIRLSITGDSLRAVESRFSLGDERVLAILPVDKLIRLEAGVIISSGQKEVDIYLDSEYESYIEIGKAHYKTRFGFERMSPLLFDGCYGVQVSRFLISTPLEKLELYAPAKGAIYVKGLSRPKRWNLQIIRRIAE